jgi:hypothetical protein
MATMATICNLISSSPPLQPESAVWVASKRHRKRKITPEAGRAIEMLGHAIEYLADELALECRNQEDRATVGKHPQVVVIELLMARNREIYLSCPIVPTLVERLRAYMYLQSS